MSTCLDYQYAAGLVQCGSGNTRMFASSLGTFLSPSNHHPPRWWWEGEGGVVRGGQV